MKKGIDEYKKVRKASSRREKSDYDILDSLQSIKKAEKMMTPREREIYRRRCRSAGQSMTRKILGTAVGFAIPTGLGVVRKIL